VLGCLVEKQMTTPQQYPLSLNALTLACNQATNRDPVVAYDEPTVQRAVTALKEGGLARFVHPSHGRSVLRFRHVLDEALGISGGPLALVAVLMLRGPQTPGELRARTERMASFADVHGAEADLEALAARPEPLVARLGRQPGQKEDRYAHLLGDVANPSAPPPDTAARAPGIDAAPAPASAPLDLAAEVARLAHEVDALRRDVDDLRRELGD
jgi:uncharacterized protein